MNNNQKAFAGIEIFLVLIVAGIIVGTGYYVWNKNNGGSVDQVVNSPIDPQNTETPTTDSEEIQYTKSSDGLKIPPMPGWKYIANLEDYDDDALLSPDFKYVDEDTSFIADGAFVSFKITDEYRGLSTQETLIQFNNDIDAGNDYLQKAVIQTVSGVDSVMYRGGHHRTGQYNLFKQKDNSYVLLGFTIKGSQLENLSIHKHYPAYESFLKQFVSLNLK